MNKNADCIIEKRIFLQRFTFFLATGTLILRDKEQFADRRFIIIRALNPLSYYVNIQRCIFNTISHLILFFSFYFSNKLIILSEVAINTFNYHKVIINIFHFYFFPPFMLFNMFISTGLVQSKIINFDSVSLSFVSFIFPSLLSCRAIRSIDQLLPINVE